MSEEKGKEPITKIVDDRRKNSPNLIIGFGIIDKKDVTVLIQRLIVLKIQEFGQCRIVCPLRFGPALNDAIKLFKVDIVEVEQSIVKGLTLILTISKQLELIQVERAKVAATKDSDVIDNAPASTPETAKSRNVNPI